MSKIIKDFIIGSAWPATIISLLYIGNAYNNTPIYNQPIPYSKIVWTLPIFFGITNALVGGADASMITMIITGIVFGILLSNIGTHIYNMPVKIFGYSEENKYITLLIAPILYAFIWGIVIYYVNQLAN